MRVLQSLAIALLPFSALAAKSGKSAEPDRFEKYIAQQRSNSGSLKLTDKIYHELTAVPRDYSVAVLLTALDPKFGCGLCQEFQPEYDLLARSWTKGDKNAESRLLYGTLEFDNGREVFQALQLSVAPVLLLFHPTVGPDAKPDGKPERFDFMTSVDKADYIHAWLSRHLPASMPKPPLVRPFNYVKVASITTGVLGTITLFTVAWPYMLPFVQNRNLWAAVSLITILLFTSGHMYNHIRGVPYVTGDGKGNIVYFAAGFQNQVGMETQIIAAIYGILTFATISLGLKVPRMSDPRAQQIAVIVWGGVLVGMFSFLLGIFRVKSPGYPFWLPPF